MTSRTLIQKGIVLDKLMEKQLYKMVLNSMIYYWVIKGIMIATRILGYGKDYTIQHPNTGEKQEETFDLT